MFFKKSKIMMKLSFQGKVVHELLLSDVKDGFELGRSKTSDWMFPEGDRLISSRHAVIERRMGKWTLVDADSKNGIYVDGTKVERVRLVPGVTMSIGQCELTVTADSAAGNALPVRRQQTQYHRLEPLNGSHKGEWIDIQNTVVRIGSDASCELCLADPHVSRLHAQLSQDARDCFIIAEKTTNPTRVNRAPMTPGIKRMLRDGDVLSFAIYDFRFLDKHVKHTRSFVWLKVTAAVLTLVALFSAYAVYMLMSDPADALLKQARTLTEKGQFTQAELVLAKAVHAREFQRYQKEHEKLLGQISVWVRTSKDWKAVQDAMEKRQWSQAVQQLSNLQCERMEDWNWNVKSALAARRQAMAAQKMLEVFSKGQALTNALQRNVDQVVAVRDKLLDGMKNPDVVGQKLFEPLLEDTAQIARVLTSDLEQHERLENTLSKLAKPNPSEEDFDALVKELNDIESRATEWVKRRVPAILEPVKKMQTIAHGLRGNMICVQELKFDKFVQTFQWPTSDECVAHSNLDIPHEFLKVANNNILESAQWVKYSIENVWKKVGVDMESPQTPDIIARWSDLARWEAVFSCNILQKRIPTSMRTEPADDYDRLLGIESFYQLLAELPERTGEATMDSLEFTPFIPELVKLRNLFKQFENFRTYVKKEEKAWLIQSGGPLPKMDIFCNQMLKKRDDLVDQLARVGDMKTDPRRTIIGRGAALYLAPAGRFDEEARNKLAEDLKLFRNATTIALDKKFSQTTAPEEQLNIRNQILTTGLPGDPMVKQKWAQRDL